MSRSRRVPFVKFFDAPDGAAPCKVPKENLEKLLQDAVKVIPTRSENSVVTGGAAAALDNTTGIASALPQGDGRGYGGTVGVPASEGRLDAETGELAPEFDRTLKWQLQAVARLALPGHRLQVCMRHVRTDKREVDVMRSRQSGKAYFKGLMACGSPWACPVCAPKIQAVRALEVRRAIDEWTSKGGRVLLMTQTIRHNRADVLETLQEGFRTAMRKFKGQRVYTRVSEAYGIAGTVKALEVTYGGNGWHPHAHTILFVKGGDLDLTQMKDDLFPCWESAVRRAGLPSVSKDAFDLQDAAKVRNYVTKMGTEYQWNAEHELVKAHSKRGGYDSITPFDMLRAHLREPGNGRWLALFAEYAYNFHGKNQLNWSRGFKKELLGEEGLTDQEIADSLGEVDDVLAHIPLEQWRVIRRHNLQGQVLQIVLEFGKEGLEQLLKGYGWEDSVEKWDTS